jgi:murein DD-endopeptidase MepM/ murein hydrolase activator NlpD
MRVRNSTRGALPITIPVQPRGVTLSRRQLLMGTAFTTLGMVWATAETAVEARARATGDTAPNEAASIRDVVPGGHIGQYRHGTYPSRGLRTHMGVDIVACGTLIKAPAVGTIVDAIRTMSEPDFESLGYMLIVQHPATLTDRVFYTLYLHLQAPPVQAERVERGAELGQVGATGRATGCHLHLEVRYFRDRVSPIWGNIYGPGDQRASRHFHENWEDPVTFLARLAREHPTA